MRAFQSLFVALSLVLAVPALAQRAEPEVQPAQLQAKRTARPMPEQAATVTLPAAVPPKLEAAQKMGAPTQVGFGRDVAELSQPGEVARALQWNTFADGSAEAALRIVSPGASALRASLLVESLPAGTTLRFIGTEGEPFEVAAGAIPTGEAFWSPVVEGDTLLMAIDVPAGSDPGELRLAVPQVSHLYTSISTGFLQPKAAASSCNLDASCYSSWSSQENAVARIIFTKGGSSFACTGTLLADTDTATTIPYFITANHCITDQSVASSIQFYWFYRSTACNSGIRGDYRTTTGGGTLLYSTQTTDTSFLRLNATPPAGAVYAGWIASGVSAGSSVTAIHHPAADLQKISFGNVRSYWVCVPGTTGQFDCSGSSANASTFYSATWSQGITEGGSSGSGLFTDNGHYLVGTLYGGNGSCSSPGSDFYGRFDVAYNNGLSTWLSGIPSSGGGGGGGGSSSGVSPAYDVADLWWNASESGWGLSLTQHTNSLFGAWYAYDGNGRPRWVVMPGGTWTTPTTFTGDLYMTSGPNGLGATFDASRVVRTKVGVGTLTFAARDRGVLTYTVNGVSGSKAISRQPFGLSNSISLGAYGDMWWNAAESGWGLSISQQYGTLFAVWYTYGADGQPVWYVLPGGTWGSNDTYTGTLYRTAAAPTAFFGGTFDPNAVTRTAVGTMTLRFTGSSTATLSYTVDGTSGTKAITRQPF